MAGRQETLKVGQIVRASAGKERIGRYGGFYMIVEILPGGYVALANGKERPLARPKRKNVRHVCPTATVLEHELLTDRALRRTLQAFANSVDQNE